MVLLATHVKAQLQNPVPYTSALWYKGNIRGVNVLHPRTCYFV